ncbi:hypothetical protein [Cupriavidus metallidurans]|uniref:hypothetical protein n=1 Tax=Cupriavidus metallidurans TaxID=119219 RepID=UPI00078773B6|nr:hypothetical protein [Cupriavidus metallidurans]AVA36296.1 hypothetical protein C3Z06_23570 [Cupriavidus metallidurans]AVA36617.1 hypothetical protein C3Z06_25370 [Cupriavidus metallidurans]
MKQGNSKATAKAKCSIEEARKMGREMRQEFGSFVISRTHTATIRDEKTKTETRLEETSWRFGRDPSIAVIGAAEAEIARLIAARGGEWKCVLGKASRRWVSTDKAQRGQSFTLTETHASKVFCGEIEREVRVGGPNASEIISQFLPILLAQAREDERARRNHKPLGNLAERFARIAAHGRALRR